MKIKIDYVSNLQNLIKNLKENGVKPKDYKNFELELDYSQCYYESERPSITCEGEIKGKK